MIEAIETIKAIMGLCIVVIVANVFSLLESVFPRIEAWFYGYISYAQFMAIADFIFLLAFIIKGVRWLS